MTLDADGRVQDRLNHLAMMYGTPGLIDRHMMKDLLKRMSPPPAPTEYRVLLVAAASPNVFGCLNDSLTQRRGQSLDDYLEQLDEGILPDQLSQLNLADLSPDLDHACRSAARFLEDRADLSEGAPDACDWAARALVTAVRYEHAYAREVGNNTWKRWLLQ